MNQATRKALRVILEIALIVVALSALTIIVKGIGPAAPGVARLLRVLLHPFTLIAIALLFLLTRLGRTRDQAAKHDRTGPD